MTALKWFKSRKGQQTLIILAFMIIPLALLFIFTYLPFGEMVKFSFYKMKYTTPVDKRVFVGLKNYAEVFRNKDIFASLKLSLYYMAGSIVQLALALYLATILSFKTKGGNFFKGLMFFPYLISGIAIYFEGKGFITKWDGAEDSDIEPIKGGLSDSMKRAAYQWGIGRVLYSLDTVWVDIERRGRSYIIKASERKKLDDAYLNALKKLGLEPAAASGIQSLLMPKTAPEQKAAGNQKLASTPAQDQRSGGTAQQSAEPQNRSAQQKPQAGPKKQEHASEPTGKTVSFRNTAQAMPEEDIYTVLAAKVQGGMSGSNTLVNLETPEKKQTYAYVRGGRPELTPGTQLSHVKLTTRKQDTVVFCVLESYEVYQRGQQAA